MALENAPSVHEEDTETKGLFSMNLYKKRFFELSTDELYRILQARCAIFVVEQECAYQDLDGIDRQALHVWLEDESQILAYLRIFAVPDLADAVQIGRVLTTVRGKGLGTKILQAGIAAILGFFTDVRTIRLEAQCYATGFYTREGFAVQGEPFDEDGIPHVLMERPLVLS